MNKLDVARYVSKQTNFTMDNSLLAATAVFDAINDGLSRGEKITIQGVGSFIPHERAARNYRHPQTGEMIRVAEKKTYRFKLAPGVLDTLNGK